MMISFDRPPVSPQLVVVSLALLVVLISLIPLVPLVPLVRWMLLVSMFVAIQRIPTLRVVPMTPTKQEFLVISKIPVIVDLNRDRDQRRDVVQMHRDICRKYQLLVHMRMDHMHNDIHNGREVFENRTDPRIARTY
jgi:hypothetical protein